jgi:hypothetical protein
MVDKGIVPNLVRSLKGWCGDAIDEGEESKEAKQYGQGPTGQ